MKRLTPRQQQILDLIRSHLQEQGMPPTRQEIARMLGVRSVNGVEDHLKALVRKGYIELLSGRNRNIRLLQDAGHGQPGLPLVGRVAAGTPILAEQNIEAHYSGADLFQPRAHYLLRVQGLSMRDAGIGDGDLLAVHRTPEARNGQIVVARLQDDVTVKRFRRQQHRVQLLPENPDFAPIEIDLRTDACVIEGIAVGVIRNLG
ncbi:MAG: transcriptional repressor LexA [Candidatus Tectomicrobia bacterium]|nr:transcriptional repressor LexA [Candidatus Tectomicrobia bacterium]